MLRLDDYRVSDELSEKELCDEILALKGKIARLERELGEERQKNLELTELLEEERRKNGEA